MYRNELIVAPSRRCCGPATNGMVYVRSCCSPEAPKQEQAQIPWCSRMRKFPLENAAVSRIPPQTTAK